MNETPKRFSTAFNSLQRNSVGEDFVCFATSSVSPQAVVCVFCLFEHLVRRVAFVHTHECGACMHFLSMVCVDSRILPYTHVCMHMYINTCIYIYIYIYIYKYVYLYTWIHNIHICIHTKIYIKHTYIHSYTCTYIHTYAGGVWVGTWRAATRLGAVSFIGWRPYRRLKIDMAVDCVSVCLSRYLSVCLIFSCISTHRRKQHVQNKSCVCVYVCT